MTAAGVQASLLVEGGGMRGFYSAGIVRRLMDEGIALPYVIGISSGALVACGYVAGVLEPNFAALAGKGPASLLSPRGFFAPHKGILRTDALIGALMTEDACEGALRARARLLVCATRASTGELAWWDQRTCEGARGLRERIVASASIPFLMPEARVAGEVYADGGIRDSIPVDKALADGVERHVLVLSRPRGYRKGPQHLELYLRHVLAPYPALKRAMLERHVHYNASVELAERLEDEGRAFVFRPEETNVGRFELAPAKLEALFRAGYAAAGARMGELVAFLGR